MVRMDRNELAHVLVVSCRLLTGSFTLPAQEARHSRWPTAVADAGWVDHGHISPPAPPKPLPPRAR